jgi:hypothetical protein
MDSGQAEFRELRAFCGREVQFLRINNVKQMGVQNSTHADTLPSPMHPEIRIQNKSVGGNRMPWEI